MIASFRKKIINKIKRTRSWSQFTEAIAYDRFPLKIEGVKGGLRPFLLSEISHINKGAILVVTPTEKEAESLIEDLKMTGEDPVLMPERERLVYSTHSLNQTRSGLRLAALAALSFDSKRIVVTTAGNMMQPVMPRDFFLDQLITLKKGMKMDPLYMEKRLAELGYLRVSRVSAPGEFSLKGEVLDIYLPGQPLPFRVIYEWDEIEQLKTFNPGNFVSVDELSEVMIYPAKETCWTAERKDLFKQKVDSKPVLSADSHKIIAPLYEDDEIPNEDLFYQFSFEKPGYLADYLDQTSLLFLTGSERCHAYSDLMKREWMEMYTLARREKVPAPHPEDLIISFSQSIEGFKRRISLFELRDAEESVSRLNFDSIEPSSFFGNINFLKQEIGNLCLNHYDIFLFADSEVQQSRIEHILKEFPVNVVPLSISQGFIIPSQKLALINDREIFGRKRRVPASVKKARSRAIETFVDLEPGDYVVHINYGIGRFESIERVKAAGNERDYIKIEFADEEYVFIPVEQVNLIQKYIGSAGSAPRLDRIGGKSWAVRKSHAKKSVEDLAEHLLGVYAKRKQAIGYSFSLDTEWQIEFEAAFPFEETPDQLQCVEEIKQDMESGRPMDRLVCGDVGYGKTEVALRAIFKAVVDGRQVALLAPTTILVEQHYENAIERFKNFPVKIEMVSRFVKPAKIKEALKRVKEGEVDLIIGTHRLLSKDVEFKNLGLLVIDEEQRFGVKHKERLKDIKSSIDCLALSATPIPRTLHMSLLKIRDMSLLTTAPYNRRPIETYIREFDGGVIAKAIENEIDRDGQVFFLHNRIETLDAMQGFIEDLVPAALVRTAHGRMSAAQLEDLMHSFIRGDFHVLVATTIIENGIDIPNVNTIIIDRADTYGISQLYQLRGRVGRSSRSSFAWLLYPENSALSELAMKRLQVISDNTALGAGFKVAMKDLEIRGAGNLLGREQSGEIASIGYDLYIRMLEETVASMEGRESDFGDDMVMDLVYSGFIPDIYIADASDKMVFYKRIASIQTEIELGQVCEELDDRFGPMPNEVQSLLSLAEIRIICRKLKINSLRERKGQLEVTFKKVHLINAEKVIRMIQEGRGTVSYNPSRPQVVLLKTEKIGLKEKSEFIRDMLTRLL